MIRRDVTDAIRREYVPGDTRIAVRSFHIDRNESNTIGSNDKCLSDRQLSFWTSRDCAQGCFEVSSLEFNCFVTDQLVHQH